MLLHASADELLRLQVHHNQSLESPAPLTAPFAQTTVQSTSSRRLMARPSLEGLTSSTKIEQVQMLDALIGAKDLVSDLAHDANVQRPRLHSRFLLTDGGDSAPADLWYGYDVKFRPKQVHHTNGNFTPRYVSRNLVLGGLYFRQVRELACYLGCPSAGETHVRNTFPRHLMSSHSVLQQTCPASGFLLVLHYMACSQLSYIAKMSFVVCIEGSGSIKVPHQV